MNVPIYDKHDKNKLVGFAEVKSKEHNPIYYLIKEKIEEFNIDIKVAFKGEINYVEEDFVKDKISKSN